MIHHSKLSMLLLVVISLAAHSQNIVPTAAEFLLTNPSPEANAQGGTSVSRITDDAYAISFNPAHLGFSSAQSNATFSFYPTKTDWRTGLGLPDLTYNSYVASAGINLENYLSVPVSVGVAYSRVDLAYGKWNWIRAGNPDSILITFYPEEHNDAYSIGFGFDTGIQVAVGITFRRIESNLVDYGSGLSVRITNSSLWSHDFGFLVNIPVIDLIAKKNQILPNISPFCNLSFGSALKNVGDKMLYVDESREALPRTISVGTTMEFGCHDYVKANPTCWDCHVVPKGAGT
jgi:hypothetical protein